MLQIIFHLFTCSNRYSMKSMNSIFDTGITEEQDIVVITLEKLTDE